MVLFSFFAGFYPDPSVPPTSGLAPIQKEVAYSPNIHFCGFDIAVFRYGQESRGIYCLHSFAAVLAGILIAILILVILVILVTQIPLSDILFYAKCQNDATLLTVVCN